MQDDIWTVEVDRGQIDQVLLNLYVNAWQAMPGGGELYLETRNEILDNIFVKAHGVKASRFVKISVSDTGVGMDESTRERVFDPFFSTKEMGWGTGLGLASAYGIIKNHDGIIDVYSEVGKGSTFVIFLPASGEEVISKDVEASDSVINGQGRILLVDDEEMILDVATQLLKSLGYDVITATNCDEALKIYPQMADEIDLVLLDMIMPEKGGGGNLHDAQET